MASEDIAQQEVPLEDRLGDIGMEDSDELKEIFDMVVTRASVTNLASRYGKLTFDYFPPTIEKLRALKEAVEGLAPKFVNMDYPYWEMNWTEFPIAYSADYIARDEEHSLNILPAYLSSFDDDTVSLYRQFLKNVVYWLKKFRYVRSTISYTDMTFQRRWNGIKRWSSLTGQYEYDSFYENGEYFEGDSGSFARLMASQQGYIYRNRKQIWNGQFVDCSTNDLNEDHYYDHLRRRPYGPLTDVVQEDRNYHLSNVPHNLMTPNPSGYQADVYWYLSQRNGGGNNVQYMVDREQCTEKDEGHVYTWGDNNEYSGTNYSATRVEREEHNKVARTWRVDYEYEYQKQIYTGSASDTYHVKRTRWSRDGERSYVYEDTTTYRPDYPSSRINITITDIRLHPLGKVIQPAPGSHDPPRFLAGTVAPHETLTYNFCEMSSLPAPPQWPTYVDPGGIYEWGIDHWCTHSITAGCNMYCILDYGDFVIPEPEEP